MSDQEISFFKQKIRKFRTWMIIWFHMCFIYQCNLTMCNPLKIYLIYTLNFQCQIHRMSVLHLSLKESYEYLINFPKYYLYPCINDFGLLGKNQALVNCWSEKKLGLVWLEFKKKKLLCFRAVSRTEKSGLGQQQ